MTKRNMTTPMMEMLDNGVMEAARRGTSCLSGVTNRTWTSTLSSWPTSKTRPTSKSICSPSRSVLSLQQDRDVGGRCLLSVRWVRHSRSTSNIRLIIVHPQDVPINVVYIDYVHFFFETDVPWSCGRNLLQGWPLGAVGKRLQEDSWPNWNVRWRQRCGSRGWVGHNSRWPLLLILG